MSRPPATDDGQTETAGQHDAGEGAGTMPEPSAASCSAHPRDLRLAGSRLQDLPQDLLRRILRLASRPARLACRPFWLAHGPLSGGLYLNARSCQDLLRRAAASPVTSLARIHTLVISQSNPPPPGYLRALPTLLPALQSLRLSLPAVPDASTLVALAPLSRSLTHISHLPLDMPALSALTAALPSLRSIGVTLTPVAVVDALTVLAGGLPHLLRLSLACSTDDTPVAANLLRCLAGGLPHLTSLALRNTLKDWNQEAAMTLACAWPQLANLGILFEDYQGPVVHAAAAGPALAQHTALTRLHITAHDIGEWKDDQQAPPLRELSASSFGWEQQTAWAAAVAAGVSSITRLVLADEDLILDRCLAGNLSRMGDRLVSLELGIMLPSWRPLAQLSRLSRLQDLSLHELNGLIGGVEDPAGVAQEVASGLAAGLRDLCFLDLRLPERDDVLPALVAGLATHGCQRELGNGFEWDLRWPVRLMAVADSLARLSISTYTTSVAVAISSLKGLHQLHWLKLWLRKPPLHSDGGAVPQPLGMEAAFAAGSTGSAQEADAAQWPEWPTLVAGARAAHGGQHDGAGQVWLPPRLRVLVLDMQLLGEKLQGVLREAAGRQECMMLDEMVPAEWDDCGGYEEGASLQWLRKHGRL